MSIKFSSVLSLIVFLLFQTHPAFAQNNPIPQALPYSQNFSAYTGSTTAYLPGWQGWTITGSTTTAFPTAAPSGNQIQSVGTNSTTSPGVFDFNGKIGFLNSSVSIKTFCVSINTMGYDSLQVFYVVATQRTRNIDRIGNVGLQYRIGATGPFTDIGTSYQNNNTTTNDTGTGMINPITMNVLLPASCNNQSEVQLRWVYRDVSGSGGRPSFSIDDVSICTPFAWYADADSDGYGDAATTLSYCTQPYGYVSNNTDCNDAVAAINTAAIEICNSIDDNCSGAADEGLFFVNYYTDADGDGYGAGSATNSCTNLGFGNSTSNGDCNDAATEIHPEAIEICNGIDDNCSGVADEGIIFANTLPISSITTTGSTTLCQGSSVLLNANTAEGYSYQWELNGVNITGATSSSYTANSSGSYTLVVTNENTCSSISAATVVIVNALPSATVIPSGVTNFCEGESVLLNVNSEIGNFYQWYNNGSPISGANTPTYNANETGSFTLSVTNASSCTMTSSPVNISVYSNSNYFADADADGFGNALNTLTTCTEPTGYVLNNLDCSDDNASINPTVTETCNSIDDNCNLQIDEGLAFTNYFSDNDGDGFGSPAQAFPSCVPLNGMVTNNGDCNDGNASINPFASEIVPNGFDENCDGLIDNTIYNSAALCSGPAPGVICAVGQSTTICAPSWPWLPGQWRFNGGPVFSQSYCVTVAEPGSYTCTALNHFTAQTLTFGYSVILDTPATPTISCSVQPLGNNQGYITLTASNGNGYLWSTGETSQTITVPNLGGYSVQVLNGNCCPETSLPTGVFSNPGCTDLEACNYNSNADCNNGSCVYPGCTDPQACNFDPAAGCDDGSCLTVYGCSDPVACNYNSIVVCDNGSCIYPGCTNPQAVNYNALAGCDDGSCSFAVTFRVDMSYVSGFSIPEVNGTFNGWWGGQMIDSNSDGIWEATLSIPAGSYEYKFAYDYWSGQENLLEGSPCTITNSGYTNRTLNVNSSIVLPVVCWGFCSACSEVLGCTDSSACNYDPTAGINDGTCNYGGCLNNLACNYEPTSMCDNGSCIFPGCNNPNACNFNPLAGCDDGSCILPGCTDLNACNYNAATICDDGSCVYPGCTDGSACNYNPIAGCDDSSCYYPYSSCNDAYPESVLDTWFSWSDFGGGGGCICIGTTYLYGNVGESDTVLCPLETGYYIDGISLPSYANDPLNPISGPVPVEIDNYTLQWYYKSGSNSAPLGSSTSGWNIIPGEVSPTLSISPFAGTRTFACFEIPSIAYGIPSQWIPGARIITYSSFAAQTIIGNPNITPFNAYNYIVNPIPGHTYNWSVTNGAIASGQGTNNVSIMWGQNGPYQITLTESDGTCSGSSYLFAVNNNCSISVSAASSTTNTFCAGTTLQLQAATSATGITYQWYLNGTLIPNETNQNISISAGGNYQVSINQNGCTAVSNIVSINQLPSAIIPSILVEQANAGCAGGEATLTVSGGTYTNLLWNNGLTASSINVTASGDFSITAVDENGCAVSAGPVSVNFSILDPVPVCIVTVDQVTGKNNVVWEPVTSDLINSYVVLKETNVANEYAQIGTVAYGSNGIFEDLNSDPQIQANRYKLALIDTCGILSSTSNFHKTIHLTANQGLGSNVNLIWSDYEGFDFGSYSIYRGSSASSLNLLTTIASNLNSFTDVNPPVGETYYMIEVAGVSCDPQRTLVYSHSNILDSTVGIEEFTSTRISLYPNPASTSITLQVNTPLIGEEYVVLDAIGKVIYKNKIQSTNELIQLENFNNGNYFVKVNEVVKRFVVQH